ncbi:MAG: DUF3021 domain-containing protein [Clostridia bacterium]|nr:DUF3021 domain-containing protein [Clostridia bacterium]
MNKYLKIFLHRGLVFGGFGPIILAIIYATLQQTLPDFSVSGTDVCLGIVSTYLLAFLQAGGSVFNQIEHWSPARSTLCHFGLLYVAYVLCYLLNTWIPFRAEVIGIFTAIFVAGYFVIWFTVWLCVRVAGKRLNRMLRR